MKDECKRGEFYGATYDAINKYYQIQSQAWQDVAELQLHFANLWQECLNAHFQRISAAKSLTDLLAAESGLVTEYSAKFSEDLRQFLETLSKTQREFMDCFNQSEELYRILPLFKEPATKEEKKTEKHPRQHKSAIA